jgi:3-oxoacyl-[acyl-carrier protein] reductase
MKNILVTGVSRGLGLEILKYLISQNCYRVYGISRSAVNFSHDNFISLNYDLENYNNIESYLKSNIGNNIQIDAFINNAAFAYDDIITNMNLSQLTKMYNINVFSPIAITKFCLRNMIYNKTQGSIVHISSISVHTGYNGLSMYASTKGALEAFSKNTAREWGRKGIRSNCLVAGFMETDMSSTLNNDQKQRIYQRTSLKKPTELASVSNTIEFLISNKSNSITGQNIHVDSGTI